MWNYFFIGTLMDADVADHILGRPLSSFAPKPATLYGYKRVYVEDATYPGIVLHPESSVGVILVRDVTADEVNKLNAFEGPDYDTHTVMVESADGEQIEARVFVPAQSMALTNKPWSLEEWQRTEKVEFLNGMARGELV
jgi:hypothetical protein